MNENLRFYELFLKDWMWRQMQFSSLSVLCVNGIQSLKESGVACALCHQWKKREKFPIQMNEIWIKIPRRKAKVLMKEINKLLKKCALPLHIALSHALFLLLFYSIFLFNSVNPIISQPSRSRLIFSSLQPLRPLSFSISIDVIFPLLRLVPFSVHFFF